MQLTIEKQRGTVEDVGSRMTLQRKLLEFFVQDGKLSEEELATAEGMKKISDIFRQVSDIIDSDDQGYESIRNLYRSGDYDGAAKMIEQYIKL